jgi:hypothetical protein
MLQPLLVKNASEVAATDNYSLKMHRERCNMLIYP